MEQGKTLEQILEDFEDEFGIHFKDSSGELQFVKIFITESIKEAFEAVELEYVEVSYPVPQLYNHAVDDQKEKMDSFLNK